MPKHDFLTPKAISNRIKSIGLQKLRWYCQMCQKQCRDENGFKCHTTSEGHLRQMRIFADNPNRVIDEYSSEFMRGFIDTLSHRFDEFEQEASNVLKTMNFTRHGTKRVLANRVYQEYIGDKHHVHMNSTVWTSLTGLCKYLGKEGKAVVDETEKGWFIQYIDRDPKLLAKQMAASERQKADLDEDERQRRMIDAQIKAAGGFRQDPDEEGHDDSGNDGAGSGAEQTQVEVSMKLGADTKKRKAISFEESSFISSSISNKRTTGLTSIFDSDEPPAGAAKDISKASDSSSSSSASSNPRLSQMEQIMQEEERRRSTQMAQDEKKNRKDYWLHPGILVKIMNKKVAEGKYYKQKGVVLNVLDHYVGEVKVDGAILRLDQEHLETVVPKVGHDVLIVNGRGRGLAATVLRINESQYNCDIRVVQPAPGVTDTQELFYGGRELKGIEYEDISKLADGV